MSDEFCNHNHPLTAETILKMKARQIKKHGYSMIWMHWFNFITWIALLLTGAALIDAGRYRFIPLQVQQIIASLFEGRHNMLKFHVWFGVLWVLVFLIFLSGSILYWPIIKSVFLIDRDDLNWLKAKMLGIMNIKVEYPPQGFFNGGQKMFAVSVYVCTPVIMISGLIMAFQLLPPLFIRFSVVVHYLAVFAVIIGLPVHIFMAGFYAPERENFHAMFTGHISEWFLFRHNYKWWLTLPHHKHRHKP
jgi:formate dehydrogenase subunit gamma